MSEKTSNTTEVSNTEPIVDALAVRSFQDAVQQFGGADQLVAAEGFDIKTKDELIGVPMLITRISEGKDQKYGQPFLIVEGITATDKSFLFTDGSTGVQDELRALMYKNNGRTAGFILENGLSKSEYTYKDPSDNKDKPAVTFHIA